MNRLSIRKGESLPLQIVTDDLEAETATLTVKGSITDAVALLTKTVPLVEGVGDLSLSASETLLPVGSYLYQLTISGPDSYIKKYPDAADCYGDDDCSFPEFEICPALDYSEVS